MVGQAAAPHPDGTDPHPERWWRALASAGHGLLDRAEATGSRRSAQHGRADAGGVVARVAEAAVAPPDGPTPAGSAERCAAGRRRGTSGLGDR